MSAVELATADLWATSVTPGSVGQLPVEQRGAQEAGRAGEEEVLRLGRTRVDAVAGGVCCGRPSIMFGFRQMRTEVGSSETSSWLRGKTLR
jgi:hypothetical protein